MAETESREVWRVSYGTADRQYLQVFQAYDVALVGWGDYGDWHSSDYGDLGIRARSSIRTLADRISAGDIVLATRGFWEVGAIGLAANDPATGQPYRWNRGWVETEGWDLYHQIRVRWLADLGRPPRPTDSTVSFPRAYYASRVGDEKVRHWAHRRIAANLPGSTRRRLRDLPEEEEPLTRSAIPRPFLEAQRVTSELQHAYGDSYWEISENTIVVHQIVPLLRGLGFKPSQIRVEWGRVDVAVVEEENWEKPILIVEAKAPRKGLGAAREQGFRYGRSRGNPPLLVTNGLTLELYGRGRYDSSPARAYLPMPRSSALTLFTELENLAS